MKGRARWRMDSPVKPGNDNRRRRVERRELALSPNYRFASKRHSGPGSGSGAGSSRNHKDVCIRRTMDPGFRRGDGEAKACVAVYFAHGALGASRDNVQACPTG